MEEKGTLTSIHSPEQAIREYAGGQFVVWLCDEIVSQTQRWEVLDKLTEKQPTSPQFRKFLLQLFLSERAMWDGPDGEPGFLRFAIANLSESDDPAAEHALEYLQTSLLDEGLSDYWSRLFEALEMPTADLKRVEPKEITRNYIAELSEVYSNAEWQEAVGSFAAMQVISPFKYEAALKLARGLGLGERDTEALKTLSGRVNFSRQLAYELLEKISFSEDFKELIWQGVQKTLSTEEEFLSQVSHYLEKSAE